jgi:hypothetical protein
VNGKPANPPAQVPSSQRAIPGAGAVHLVIFFSNLL